MDTHDRTRELAEGVSEEEFLGSAAFGEALEDRWSRSRGAREREGVQSVCFTWGPDADAIRRAHMKVNFPSIRSPRFAG
jgi:hypothetical protein